MGYMSVYGGWIDVHGAGAQRSDPKTGNPVNFPTGFGPQGDAIRIYNYVRLVRNTTTIASVNGINENDNIEAYPNPVSNTCTLSFKKQILRGVIDISDLQNRKIHSVNIVDAKKIDIDMSSLPKGVFLITIFDGISIFTKKIMKS
jgi:hypothetical protein